jgi:hypothetical protein
VARRRGGAALLRAQMRAAQRQRQRQQQRVSVRVQPQRNAPHQRAGALQQFRCDDDHARGAVANLLVLQLRQLHQNLRGARAVAPWGRQNTHARTHARVS